jgi:hypothetical protein
LGVERKDRLDHVAPRDDGFARRERSLIEAKSVRADVARALHQFRGERYVAAERCKLPGEAEQVSPMAVWSKQVGQRRLIATRNRCAKRADPWLSGLPCRFLRRCQLVEHCRALF